MERGKGCEAAGQTGAGRDVMEWKGGESVRLSQGGVGSYLRL